ncbi:hypothetical protein RSAG8_02351, partial [Rhizoctonia solani AG-8 WAC10335]
MRLSLPPPFSPLAQFFLIAYNTCSHNTALFGQYLNQLARPSIVQPCILVPKPSPIYCLLFLIFVSLFASRLLAFSTGTCDLTYTCNLLVVYIRALESPTWMLSATYKFSFLVNTLVRLFALSQPKLARLCHLHIHPNPLDFGA